VNGEGEITEHTRNRVQSIIQELGYRPNAIARSLVMGKSLLVGVVIPQITDAFYPEFINGVERTCKEHGYGVLLGNTDEDPEQELVLIETMADKQVDGIILCGTRLDAQQLSEVAERHHAVIVTSQHPQNATSIHIPGKEGLYRTTEYLAGLGHQRIGHLGFRREGECERLTGYRAALSTSGLKEKPGYVVLVDRLTIEEGCNAMKEILRRRTDITALACYNDVLAIGAILECHERGVEVPREFSITGFDDLPLSKITQPTLTTIHVPRYQLGEMAASMLFNGIDQEPTTQVNSECHTELIIRESTTPPASKHDA